jgi:hypothetical protein
MSPLPHVPHPAWSGVSGVIKRIWPTPLKGIWWVELEVDSRLQKHTFHVGDALWNALMAGAVRPDDKIDWGTVEPYRISRIEEGDR